MRRYIAFLRAINVGGHTVKMDALRKLFEEMELAAVETFIASGNVIFESAARDPKALERKIEAHLHKSLGYEVRTFLRTPAELAAVAAHQPFPPDLAAAAHAVYVAFLSEPPSAEAQQRLLAVPTEVDEFRFRDRELHWLCKARFSDSRFSGPLLEKALKMQTTVRNVTTVGKLAAKYAAD